MGGSSSKSKKKDGPLEEWEKDSGRRVEIGNEILSTEQSYVASLEILVQVKITSIGRNMLSHSLFSLFINVFLRNRSLLYPFVNVPREKEENLFSNPILSRLFSQT